MIVDHVIYTFFELLKLRLIMVYILSFLKSVFKAEPTYWGSMHGRVPIYVRNFAEFQYLHLRVVYSFIMGDILRYKAKAPRFPTHSNDIT